MHSSLRKLTVTAVGIALFVVLALCLQVPVFQNYYLLFPDTFGFISRMFITVFFKSLSGALLFLYPSFFLVHSIKSAMVFKLPASGISMTTSSASSMPESITIIFMDSADRSSRISVESVMEDSSTS